MLVAGLLAGATAGPASGARPAGGSKFYGFQTSAPADELVDKTAELRVSRDGRHLARSYVRVVFDGRCNSRDFRARLGRRVRIRRNGTFTAKGGRGARRFSIRGRFVSRDHARVSYRASGPRRGRARRSCRMSRRVELYRNGEPPFSSCRTQRAKTVLRSPGIRVFRQLRFLRDPDDTGFYPYLYACVIDNGRRVPLGRDTRNGEGLQVVRLTDPFVAFGRYVCGGLVCFTDSVEVVDVRTGSRKKLAQVHSLEAEAPPMILDLELKQTGAVGWIATAQRDRNDPSTAVTEVWAADRAGQRMLDSGPGIDGTSLTLSGSTLSWRNGSVRRSATID